MSLFRKFRHDLLESFAATSRMAVLVCPGEISVVGQNLTSILQNIFVGKETFWGLHSANLAG